MLDAKDYTADKAYLDVIACGQEHIQWLQIPVHNPFVVQVRQRAAHFSA